MSRLIDADALLDKFNKQADLLKALTDKADDFRIFCKLADAVEDAPTIDAVPVNELLKLRDWFYESDSITMGGLRSLNELIAKYSSNPLPRIENGFERR